MHNRPMAVLLLKALGKRKKKEGSITYVQLSKEMAENGCKVTPAQVRGYLLGLNVPYKESLGVLEAISKTFKLPLRQVVSAARFRPRKGYHYTESGNYVRTHKEPRVTITMLPDESLKTAK